MSAIFPCLTLRLNYTLRRMVNVSSRLPFNLHGQALSHNQSSSRSPSFSTSNLPHPHIRPSPLESHSSTSLQDSMFYDDDSHHVQATHQPNFEARFVTVDESSTSGAEPVERGRKRWSGDAVHDEDAAATETAARELSVSLSCVRPRSFAKTIFSILLHLRQATNKRQQQHHSNLPLATLELYLRVGKAELSAWRPL